VRRQDLDAWKEGLRRGEVQAAVEVRQTVLENISSPEEPVFRRHSSNPVLSDFVPLALEP
jgi:hypothetical protein